MSGQPVKYQFEVDLDDPNNAHSLLHSLVTGTGRQGMEILEVGCSSGYVGATLAAKGHRVTGVEPDPIAAEAARPALQEVCNDTADGFFDAHPSRRFDAVLFGDVLEHIADPAATLRRCVAHLAADGFVAISLPCITHGSIRAMLLDGRWDYADYGLLDRTHLRFFSREGMARLMADGGLEISKLLGTVMPIQTVIREYGMAVRAESIAAVEALSHDDADLLVFQFVLTARPPRGQATHAELLAHNLAMPLEKTVAAPRPSGHRSMLQQLRRQAFMALLRGMTRRRFRT
jgi:2-polyprenyl-3-methyl-5-hydroxy-6-metoxy-1,4-benzoquinol methylase